MFFWFVWKLMKIVCRLSLLWESRPLPTSWTLRRSQHKIPRGVLQSNDTCPEAASENVGYKWKYHKRQRLLSLYFCKGYQHIRIFEGSSDQGLGVKALKHQKLPATRSPYHSINDQLHETLDVFTSLQSISKKERPWAVLWPVLSVQLCSGSMSCNSLPFSASTQGENVQTNGREKCKDHYRREKQKERMH